MKKPTLLITICFLYLFSYSQIDTNKNSQESFEEYTPKLFSEEENYQEECIEYVKYSKEIVVPEGYLVDCEKK